MERYRTYRELELEYQKIYGETWHDKYVNQMLDICVNYANHLITPLINKIELLEKELKQYKENYNGTI